jgi:phosphatidylserine/phosphatidylglycerophosphate/cardiolipin synthase-like enzyme
VFKFSHAKYLVIDGTTAVVLSGNFNMAAIDTTTAKGERNYGFVDHDADDAARIESIFQADWTSTSGAEPDLGCTRLVISPVNAKQRILDHIASATKTLDIEVLYLDDVYVRAAILDRASHGVAVRVMLSDPTRNPQNTAALQYFTDNHVAAKLLLTNYLHTKMIQADGVALVGSENMSETSLTLNRELGALLFEPEPAGRVHAQYEADWANAQ